MTAPNAERRPGANGAAPMKLVEREPGGSFRIIAPTSGAGQTPAPTRADVEVLILRVRAAAMHLSTQTSRDDRRTRDSAEGPCGWDWAHSRFTAALDELRDVAFGLVAVVEQGGAVDVEPRARGLQRHTESRTTRSSCQACGRTFSSSGTAASHAAARRHVVEVEYRTAFRFEPAGLPS